LLTAALYSTDGCYAVFFSVARSAERISRSEREIRLHLLLYITTTISSTVGWAIVRDIGGCRGAVGTGNVPELGTVSFPLLTGEVIYDT
jgi:hypothetical protein